MLTNQTGAADIRPADNYGFILDLIFPIHARVMENPRLIKNEGIIKNLGLAATYALSSWERLPAFSI